MPSRFETVEQARSYWSIVSVRTRHYISSMAEEIRDDRNEVLHINPGLGSRSYPVNFGAEARLRTVKHSRLPTQLGRYSAEVDRWFEAFRPFYASLENQRCGRAWAAASVLMIDAMTTQIMLSCSSHDSGGR